MTGMRTHVVAIVRQPLMWPRLAGGSSFDIVVSSLPLVSGSTLIAQGDVRVV